MHCWFLSFLYLIFNIGFSDSKPILLVVQYSDMWYRVVPVTKAIRLVTKLLIQRCVADYCSFFYLLFQFEFSNNWNNVKVIHVTYNLRLQMCLNFSLNLSLAFLFDLQISKKLTFWNKVFSAPKILRYRLPTFGKFQSNTYRLHATNV